MYLHPRKGHCNVKEIIDIEVGTVSPLLDNTSLWHAANSITTVLGELIHVATFIHERVLFFIPLSEHGR